MSTEAFSEHTIREAAIASSLLHEALHIPTDPHEDTSYASKESNLAKSETFHEKTITALQQLSLQALGELSANVQHLLVHRVLLANKAVERGLEKQGIGGMIKAIGAHAIQLPNMLDTWSRSIYCIDHTHEGRRLERLRTLYANLVTTIVGKRFPEQHFPLPPDIREERTSQRV
jgi:hypothetical protein